MTPLKHYRTKAGLTQPELAERVGISHRTLQDYEQGQKPLEGARAITVLKMARVLGCTVEDLIDLGAEYTRTFPEKQNGLSSQQTEIHTYCHQRGYKITGQFTAERIVGDSAPLIGQEQWEAVQTKIRSEHPGIEILTRDDNQ